MVDKNKTLIPLHYFYENSILEKEKEKIFMKSWIFACFKRDVLNDGDFYTLEYLNNSIVIRNFDGNLFAFNNVCSHRFSKLCLEKQGNGLFQCPYHGWTYNKRGEPYAIPDKKNFENLPEISKLKIKKFSVEVIGEFVMVNMADENLNIQRDIDNDLRTFLLTVSNAMGDKIDNNQINIKSNWKIIVENTLEDYHVKQVHPTSLNAVGVLGSKSYFSGYHSSSELEFELTLERSNKLNTIYNERPWKLNKYVHYCLFPNLTIASAFGATISIQTIKPVNCEETEFTSHVFSTILPKKDHALVKAFNENAKSFNRKVFQEDTVICESVQKGMRQATQTNGYLSSREERVWHFEQSYMNIMEGEKS